MKGIFKISLIGISVYLFFVIGRTHIYAQACPYNYCAGYATEQTPFDGNSFRGSWGTGDGGSWVGKGWNESGSRERGQPFEIVAVSNFNCNTTTWMYDPNGAPWCAYYVGFCGNGFYVNCGGGVQMEIKRNGASALRHDVYGGRGAIFDTTPHLWNTYYRWDSAGPDSTFFLGQTTNPSTGKSDYVNYLSRFGYSYSIYATSDRVRSSSGTAFSSGGCNNCSVSRGTMDVKDYRPQVDIPDLTYCTGNPMDIVLGLRDDDGIDDISDVYVNFNLDSGAVATLRFQNTTAQRYNNWRWNMLQNYTLSYVNPTFNSNMNVNVTSYPTNRGRLGAIRFTITSKGGFDLKRDITSVEAYAYDAQYSRAEDESLYGAGNFVGSNVFTGVPVWIDSPSATSAFSPNAIEHPGSSTLSWNLSEASNCELRIRSDPNRACIGTGGTWVSVPCQGNRTVESRAITAESAVCTAEIRGSNICGNISTTATLRVIYASPWMMTTFGDTYAADGYNNMRMWRVTAPTTSFVPSWGTNGGNAYFSFYLISRNTGNWTTSSSLRAYQLGSYDDENRRIVPGIGTTSLYDYFVELVDRSGSGCDEVAISTISTQDELNTKSCSGRQILFVNNSGAMTLPASWNAAAPDPDDACVVIAKDTLRIPGSVDLADTFFIITSQLTTTADTEQLRINGGVFANQINFQRDLPQDGDNPAEIITYDPKYIVLLRDCLGEEYPFRIREYNYSSAAEN